MKRIKPHRKKFLIRRAKRVFYQKIRRKSKRILSNRLKRIQYDRNKSFRLLAKKCIHTYEEAISMFSPKNLRYLLLTPKSPFSYDNLPRFKMVESRILEVPKNFSIISNPKESFLLLQQVVSSFVFQSCSELEFDYFNCKHLDLLTQVVLDSILIDYNTFVERCKRADIERKYIRIRSVGGRNYFTDSVNRIINSVGSPVYMVNRSLKFENVIPFKLQRFDAEVASRRTKLEHKDFDATNVIEYVCNCLSRFGKTLTKSAQRELGYVVGETIINAEEHSSLHYRYMIGYFEETHGSKTHFGEFHFVISLRIYNRLLLNIL